jgi:hypothetical protein
MTLDEFEDHVTLACANLHILLNIRRITVQRPRQFPFKISCSRLKKG